MPGQRESCAVSGAPDGGGPSGTRTHTSSPTRESSGCARSSATWAGLTSDEGTTTSLPAEAMFSPNSSMMPEPLATDTSSWTRASCCMPDRSRSEGLVLRDEVRAPTRAMSVVVNDGSS